MGKKEHLKHFKNIAVCLSQFDAICLWMKWHPCNHGNIPVTFFSVTVLVRLHSKLFCAVHVKRILHYLSIFNTVFSLSFYFYRWIWIHLQLRGQTREWRQLNFATLFLCGLGCGLMYRFVKNRSSSRSSEKHGWTIFCLGSAE